MDALVAAYENSGATSILHAPAAENKRIAQLFQRALRGGRVFK